MSKLVLVCHRNFQTDPAFLEKVQALGKKLTPDNISTPPPHLVCRDGVHIAIFNRKSVLPITNDSVCMGQMIGPNNNWWKPLAPVPDGCYAIFRTDDSFVEIVSDATASRTIWYAQTEKMFITSTSQRAIVFFLREFKPNMEASAWMLSSGSLGPGLSWDRRIRPLPPDSRLLLNRKSWNTEIKSQKVRFEQADLSETEHRASLVETIGDTFDNLNLDTGDWVLPISGGYDSRAILLFLKGQRQPATVTWGLREALRDNGSDAYVAKKVAEYFACKHIYYPTDLADEPIDKILNRFLVAGEGRIAHISAYMDGFRIWKNLHELGYQGVLRGDEAFGYRKCKTVANVYKMTKLTLLKDYNLFKSYCDILQQFSQQRPLHLQKRHAETLSTWRDRLDHEYHMPYVISALNDLKLPYVEVCNPLLSRKIIKQVRSLPDKMRTNKQLYKSIIEDMSPKIKFAKRPAIERFDSIFIRKDIKRAIYDELNTSYARSLLPDVFLNYLIRRLRKENESFSFFRSCERKVTNCSLFRRMIRQYNRRFGKYEIPLSALSLRAYIVVRMNAILSSDAKGLNRLP